MKAYRKAEHQNGHKIMVESRIKKLYDVKENVDDELERIVGGRKNYDSSTTHGKDSFGKFERTVS